MCGGPGSSPFPILPDSSAKSSREDIVLSKYICFFHLYKYIIPSVNHSFITRLVATKCSFSATGTTAQNKNQKSIKSNKTKGDTATVYVVLAVKRKENKVNQGNQPVWMKYWGLAHGMMSEC